MSKCNSCRSSVTPDSEFGPTTSVEATCWADQDKYMPNCGEGDLFCDYECMREGCNLCYEIHSCNYSFQEHNEEDRYRCGLCKHCVKGCCEGEDCDDE